MNESKVVLGLQYENGDKAEFYKVLSKEDVELF